jgi:hypothetical protein
MADEYTDSGHLYLLEFRSQNSEVRIIGAILSPDSCVLDS